MTMDILESLMVDGVNRSISSLTIWHDEGPEPWRLAALSAEGEMISVRGAKLKEAALAMAELLMDAEDRVVSLEKHTKNMGIMPTERRK